MFVLPIVKNMIVAMAIMSSYCEAFTLSHTNGRHFASVSDTRSLQTVFKIEDGQKQTTQLHAVTKSFSSIQKTLNDREVDMKRLMFQLSQVKDEIYEAELRATAAENRVRELKKQTEEIQAEEGKVAEKIQAKYEEETNALKEKVNFFSEALQKLKFDSHNDIMGLKSKAEKEAQVAKDEKQKLQSAVQSKSAELEAARDEISGLEKVRSDLVDLQTRSKLQAHDVTVLAKNLENAEECLKAANEESAQLKASMLGLEKEIEEQKLHYEKIVADANAKARASVSKGRSVQRRMQQEMEDLKVNADRALTNAKMDLTQQLLSAKDSHIREKEKLVNDMDTIVTEKDAIITEYEEQFGSVRKLTKQSLRVLRGRISSVLKRNKSKTPVSMIAEE